MTSYSPTPTLILFLLVSFLKFSVTPVHQSSTGASSLVERTYRGWDPGDCLVSFNSEEGRECIPLGNVLPEVCDAYKSAGGVG